MQRDKMRTLTLTALFTALVFVGTYVVKIPLPFGYTHIGDSMIFLAVMVLGWKRGAAAGAVGAALADLIGGFAVWAAPTLIAKAVMAATLGLVLDRRPFGLRGRALWLTGAAISAIVHAALYTLATALIYGGPAAITIAARGADAVGGGHGRGLRAGGGAPENGAGGKLRLHHPWEGAKGVEYL